MQVLIDEYNRQSTQSGNQKDKGSDAAFYAGGNKGKTGKKSDKDIECFNCHKEGHKRSIVGQKEVGRKDRDLDPSQRRKNPRRKQQTLLTKEKGSGWQ